MYQHCITCDQQSVLGGVKEPSESSSGWALFPLCSEQSRSCSDPDPEMTMKGAEDFICPERTPFVLLFIFSTDVPWNVTIRATWSAVRMFSFLPVFNLNPFLISLFFSFPFIFQSPFISVKSIILLDCSCNKFRHTLLCHWYLQNPQVGG